MSKQAHKWQGCYLNNFSNLPTSWQIKTLGEVCVSTNSNITFKNIQDKKGDYPIYGASGVVAYVDFYTKENQSLGIVKDGAGIGRVFLLPPKASVIGTLHYVENNDDLNLKYLFYFLQSINLARYIIGSAIPHIYFRDWKKEQIPLPSLEIQKHIVARLESAFEKIEKGSAHLQDAKTKLAKYKQSLLKSAFNGTLTATASLRGVEKAETIHKVDCHDLTSSKLAMTDKENPKLPQGWTIKTLKSFGIFIRGVSYKKEQLLKEKTTNSVFLLRANNIQEKLDLTDLQIVPKELADGKIIQDNDIVFAMSSGSKHIVGKNIILSNLQDYSFGAFCGLFRITNKDLNSHYLAYFLQSDFYRKYIVKFAKGTNINNLRFNDLENLQIPLPPLEIQKQIVKLLEKHLQHADKTGEFIESALNKAKQLKQSLLKSAFLGKLT